MRDAESILRDLRRISVDNHRCFGCGREHDCGIHGCAIIREAVDLICGLQGALSNSEEARSALGKRLAEAQQSLHEVKSEFEAKCALTANDEPIEDISQSRGDIVRSMTDLQLAYLMVYLSVHNGDPGYDLSFLWCDGLGACMSDGNCRDSWSMDCVVRYLACKASDIEIPQQPKMRIRDHEEYFTKIFACPSCGKRLCSYTFGREWTDNGLQLSELLAKRVCPSCSQAIDWSEQVIANTKEVAHETTDD